jgi:hypothetical protein
MKKCTAEYTACGNIEQMNLQRNRRYNKMKKIIALLLITVMCLPLVACGKSKEIKSEEVKNVESLISAIGSVSENSEAAILEAENAYNALTQDDKNKVSNYNTLLDARKTYDAIPKKIELTVDNFRDYFHISCSYGEKETYTALGISFANVDAIFDVYQTSFGSPNNVKVTLQVEAPRGWGLNSTDPAYSSSENDGKVFYITINMPVSGEYSETHRLGKDIVSSGALANCTIKIISVSGTFIEDK